MGSRRDQEHDGTSNTRVLTGSDRELCNTLRPVGWFVLPQMVMVCVDVSLSRLCFGGVHARPYIGRGSRVT
jgi:hypothetical protein